MKICIFASIGSQNVWDELILKNEIKLLRQEFWENIQFRVASYDAENPFFEDESVKYFEYFPIWIKEFKNILRNIKNLWVFFRNILWSDMVVIWGWGIIYDSELQSVGNPLNQWLFRANITRLFWKKLYFYALWIDIKDRKNTWKLKKIFQNSYKITVRDIASQKQLSDIWIESILLDDPVMSDKNCSSFFPLGGESWKEVLCGENSEEGIIWVHNSKSFQISDLVHYDFTSKKVWLALRSWYFWKKSWEEERIFIDKCCRYIEEKWWSIIFLPHSFHDLDTLANDYIFMKQFLTENREIKTNMQEVYEVYQNRKTDINISMRLHSIILSHVYEIPQIVLSYSVKTDEIIKKLSR